LAEETGCACEVFAQDWIAKKGMGALLAVARGSAEGPRLIVMKHTPQPGQPAVVLAGKGVTFDSGGISIKPSEGMHEMKYDMCGAAAVLGAMKTLSQMRVQTNVIAIVPTVENMPGDRATRPGDIVRAYNGKTIEIQNTDAEGRLILADALAYASDVYQPAAMADLATLTGAAIITLGHQAAAVMSTDDGLYDEIHAAAERTGERIWRLPLWDDYAEGIKAHHADLRNIGPKREAGTIIGGVFLQQFVGDTPWAHIDIAAMAWGVKNRPYWNEKNATGFGARLLTRWVLDRAAKGSE
jgi:leucyl aminopeptidase